MFSRTLMSLSAVVAFIFFTALALYTVPSAADALPTVRSTVTLQPQEEFRRPGDASMAGMVPYFEWFCINCHESNDPEMRAPSREALRRMDPERILQALTTGPMAEFVPEFNEEQLRAMAELASGKPFGGIADRTADAMSNPCASPLRLDDPFSKPAWNGWAPDPTRSYRFQPQAAAGFTGAQASNLKLKWAFAFPGAASAAWAQPTVVDGALFIGSDNNFVYALDAKTGCVHWSFEAPGQVRTAISIGEVTEVPGVRYAAMFGDYMGYVSAVDAETGEKLWTMRPDDHPASKMTGPPTLDPSPGGHLYVGVASWEEMPGMALEYGCCKFQGSVVAVDVNTGEKIWATYTFPEPAKPLGTNAAGTQLWGPAGAAVWNAPTLDLENRKLYATAGNCYITEFFEDENRYDDGACNAVFAFDMDTGERLWWTQLLRVVYDRHGGGCGMTAEEIRVNCPGFVNGPDDDPSGSPVLHTLADGRRILIQGQESGRVTALDPDNDGAILWVAQAGDTMAASNAGSAEPSTASTTSSRCPSRTAAAASPRSASKTAPASGTRRFLSAPTVRIRSRPKRATRVTGPRRALSRAPSSRARATASCARSRPKTAASSGSSRRCMTTRPSTGSRASGVALAAPARRSSMECCTWAPGTRFSAARQATCCWRST